jgi:hypothetical protein
MADWTPTAIVEGQILNRKIRFDFDKIVQIWLFQIWHPQYAPTCTGWHFDCLGGVCHTERSARRVLTNVAYNVAD